MDIKKVSLDSVLCRPEDLKLTEDDQQVYKISNSIKEYGQLVPIVCYRLFANSPLILIDGSLIVRALRYLGQNEAWVLDVGEKSEKEALKIWCALNLNNRPINYIELAKKIKSYPEIKKSMANQTVMLQEQIETLERILDFDWSCFARAKEQSQVPNMFGSLFDEES